MPIKKNNLTAYDIATAWWSLPLAERHHLQLANKLNLENPSSHALQVWLGRKIAEWEQLGNVRHQVLEEKERYLVREPELENRLRRKFELRGALIVDVALLLAPSSSQQADFAAWSDYDDKLHKHLGVWAGRLLSSVLRPGDSIGIGGGRGPLNAIQNCDVCRKVGYRGNVVALTGRMNTTAWSRPDQGEPMYIDAVDLVNLLHSSLGSTGTPRPINGSITGKTNPPLTDDLNIAVVGVGALGGGHRLTRHKELVDLKPVSKILERLNNVSIAIEKLHNSTQNEIWHPVGDVCNWYFVVDEARKERKFRKEVTELEKLVQSLNSRFVNTNTTQLAEIAERGPVITVAGGRHKLAALRHVLNQSTERPWVTHLVTDKATAMELVK